MFVARSLIASSRAAVRPAASTIARANHSSTAIAPAALAQIETRWAKLPECEQGAIADALAAKQKGDWKEMSLEEKRAAYWIAYGPYGARSPHDPAMKWKVLGWSLGFSAVAVGIWAYWTSAVVPELRTHSQEWQDETERRAIELKQNPYTGAYAELRKAEETKK
ncbi:Cytochrome c oxidase subunit 5A [Geranomyces variabilis]|uniref:Cytochrome c oxidase subunit 5A n=1 Tax=Geranomyces variabilis TaxID=109894 RepID=A0AAD5XMG7_9FUNG|nr:Cytochrome c oxidase subunit 5A [Geranomyces variabilis]